MPNTQETKELLAQMGGHLSHIRSDMNVMKVTQAQMLEHDKSVDKHLENLNSKVAKNVEKIAENSMVTHGHEVLITKLTGLVESLVSSEKDKEKRTRNIERFVWVLSGIGAVVVLAVGTLAMFADKAVDGYLGHKLDALISSNNTLNKYAND